MQLCKVLRGIQKEARQAMMKRSCGAARRCRRWQKKLLHHVLSIYRLTGRRLVWCDAFRVTDVALGTWSKPLKGSGIGLLLDLDNSGTLTFYCKDKPRGTIAEVFVRPLLPCIPSCWKGKLAEIHGGLAPLPE